MTTRYPGLLDQDQDPHPHDGGDVEGRAPFIKIKRYQITDFGPFEEKLGVYKDVVADYGAPVDATDARAQFQQALDAVAAAGGGVVKGRPGVVFGIDPAGGALTLASNVTLCLNGATLQRIGTNIATRMVENENYGVPGLDSTIRVCHGTLIGTGDTQGISGQGACLGFFDANDVTIEHIKTQKSNGDGISYRRCDQMRFNHVRVGDYGRNGISPTSGLDGHWNDVEVYGSPFAGANPGLDIDGEPDNASEPLELYWDGVRAKNATFIDFHTATAGDFLIRMAMDNCEIGPGFPGLKVKSTNQTYARKFYVGPTCYISAAGVNGNAVQVEHVGGVRLISPELNIGTATGSPNAVQLEDTIEGFDLIFPRLVGAFSRAVLSDLSLLGSVVNGARFLGVKAGTLRISGSNNEFHACNITTLEIDAVGSINNIIGSSNRVGTFTMVDGAVLANQTFTERLFQATNQPRPAAIPDTSGATLAQLEAEVNKLKQHRRTLGDLP